MTVPMITGLYAGILAFWFMALFTRVSILRGKSDISIYYGENQALGLAIRQHGNMAESVAFALVLIALLEMSGAPAWAIHSLGGILLVARLLHPFGLKWDSVTEIFRAVGVLGTFIAMAVPAGWLIYRFAVA